MIHLYRAILDKIRVQWTWLYNLFSYLIKDTVDCHIWEGGYYFILFLLSVDILDKSI